MAELASSVIARAGARLAGSAAVEPDAPTYMTLFPDIAESGADVVMVILPAPAQLTFLGQYEDSGGAADLAPYPDPVTQTRNFLAATTDYGVGLGLPRVVAWETTLADGAAADLNTRYTSRWGQPVDPTAWTAYEAVNILAQAATAVGSAEPAHLLERLGSGRAFDTAKGSLAFDERGQLRQQLYAVVPVPDAGWGITLSDKLGVARLFRTLMVDAPESGPACR